MIECPICKAEKKSILGLKTHVYMEHGHVNYKCPICGFQSEKGLCIIHYARKKDYEHELLYLVLKTKRGKKSKTPWKSINA